MKGKKFCFVLVLTALLVGGWLFTLKAASGVEEAKKQNGLLEQAESFLKRGLYVRGIPLLEQAVDIRTDRQPEIQRKLLNAYSDYGDMASYEAFLAVMEQEENAAAEDYLSLAQYKIESGDMQGALTTMCAGLKNHEDSELKQLYEDYRYAYSISQTSYEKLVPTGDAVMMPAYDGTFWNYVDERGSELLAVSAQEALPFNEQGYGVIKRDQVYCTILENGDFYGIDENGLDEVRYVTDRYVIAAKDGQYGYYNYDFECLSEELLFEDITKNGCGAAAVKRNGKWGLITDAGETVTDFIYEDVAVNSLGVVFVDNHGMVKKDGKWILIDPEGNQSLDTSYDDAKAPESEGLIAVADETGKWGFIDAKGRQVIDCQYEDAKSFSCDIGAVQTAGEWGYISADNVMVIGDRFVSAQPFHNGTAVAGTIEGAALLQLKYYGLDDGL